MAITLIGIDALDRFKTDIETEIPDSVQYSTMPTASAELNGAIVQYTGSTTASYTNGYFYKCVSGSTSGTYEWTRVNVQPGGGGSSVQSDWNQTDDTADDYIKNKPTLGTASAKASTNAVTSGSTDLVESGAVYASLQNKQDIIQLVCDVLPTASAEWYGKIVQYNSGDPALTYSNYHNGWIYMGDSTYTEQGTVYMWTPLFTDSVIQYSNKPVTSGAVYTALQGKVDTVSGKGLSTNDYTTAEQTKLSGIATGATANTVIDTTCSLTVNGWSGSSAPYSQSKSVTGILSTDKAICDLSVSSTVSTGLDQIDDWALISRIVSGNGTLTFYCYEDKPTVALTVNVKVVR